jgi:uncharacterized protein YkwD
MRMPCLAGAALLALAGCSTTPDVAHEVSTVSTGEAREAARLISSYRTARGLSPVVVDSRLNEAAEEQARAVATAGRLSHGAFMSRMARFGIGGAAAENLAAGQNSVAAAFSSWKTSPRHDENLLMPEARRIGLARADANGGFGRYWTLVLAQ